MQRAGYRYACAISPGPAGCGDFALPRMHLGRADTAPRLELKRRLAETHRNDREAYTEAKGPFIVSILRAALEG